MNNILYQYNPDYVASPGEILEEHLNSMKISVTSFSEKTSIPVSTINDIIKSKKQITQEIASIFENALEYPKQFWINLENQHQDYLTRQNNFQ